MSARKSIGQRTVKNLSKKDKKMIELHVQGKPLYAAAMEAGYKEKYAKTCSYRRFKEPPAQEYYRQLQADIIHEAALDCKWFLQRCMKVFDTCSEIIESPPGSGRYKVRDSAGAARMAAIIKDALPDFKQRLEHTITDPQVFKIGDQEIHFE
jgi:phage terminase small subunit